jgi:hypothetical protein
MHRPLLGLYGHNDRRSGDGFDHFGLQHELQIHLRPISRRNRSQLFHLVGIGDEIRSSARTALGDAWERNQRLPGSRVQHPGHNRIIRGNRIVTVIAGSPNLLPADSVFDGQPSIEAVRQIAGQFDRQAVVECTDQNCRGLLQIADSRKPRPLRSGSRIVFLCMESREATRTSADKSPSVTKSSLSARRSCGSSLVSGESGTTNSRPWRSSEPR